MILNTRYNTTQWTPEMHSFVEKNIATMTYVQMGKHLGISDTVVRKYAIKQGWKRLRKHTPSSKPKCENFEHGVERFFLFMCGHLEIRSPRSYFCSEWYKGNKEVEFC